MGVIGRLFKFVFRRLIEVALIGAILVLIPNLPPQASFTKQIQIAPSKPLTGKLSLNNRLDSVEIWHKGDFVGPEAFADLNGELYTSLLNGDIVKLTGEHITPVIKFGKPCKYSYEESVCGRPLGLEFDSNGYLYAADSYYGIFKTNVKTGAKEILVRPDQEIDGKRPRIFNSIVLASNGDIYWTDSSTEFSLEDGVFTFLADPSGRLIHYNAKTKKNTVLVDDLFFANGVALSADEEFVIVVETAASRIRRHYLKGAKKGKSDIFIDGLPGLPDNLTPDGKGGFLVPLVLSRDADHPIISQSVAPFPLIRKAVARFLGGIQWIFKKIDELHPNDFSAKAVHFIGHFSTVPTGLQRVSLLRVNRNGEITDSVHSLNKKISGISEMYVFKDTLYLGSPFNDYIARIPLAKIGWEDLKKEERVKRSPPPVEATTTTPKPTTTTTPKPTTTTARPTTQKATTTTPKPTTTTRKPTTTTPKPTTTTPKPSTTTSKPTTTKKPATTPPPTTQTPPPNKQTPPPQQQNKPSPQAVKKETAPPPTQKASTQAPPTTKQQPPKQAPKQN